MKTPSPVNKSSSLDLEMDPTSDALLENWDEQVSAAVALDLDFVDPSSFDFFRRPFLGTPGRLSVGDSLPWFRSEFRREGPMLSDEEDSLAFEDFFDFTFSDLSLIVGDSATLPPTVDDCRFDDFGSSGMSRLVTAMSLFESIPITFHTHN